MMLRELRSGTRIRVAGQARPFDMMLKTVDLSDGYGLWVRGVHLGRQALRVHKGVLRPDSIEVLEVADRPACSVHTCIEPAAFQLQMSQNEQDRALRCEHHVPGSGAAAAVAMVRWEQIKHEPEVFTFGHLGIQVVCPCGWSTVTGPSYTPDSRCAPPTDAQMAASRRAGLEQAAHARCGWNVTDLDGPWEDGEVLEGVAPITGHPLWFVHNMRTGDNHEVSWELRNEFLSSRTIWPDGNSPTLPIPIDGTPVELTAQRSQDSDRALEVARARGQAERVCQRYLDAKGDHGVHPLKPKADTTKLQWNPAPPGRLTKAVTLVETCGCRWERFLVVRADEDTAEGRARVMRVRTPGGIDETPVIGERDALNHWANLVGGYYS